MRIYSIGTCRTSLKCDNQTTLVNTYYLFIWFRKVYMSCWFAGGSIDYQLPPSLPTQSNAKSIKRNVVVKLRIGWPLESETDMQTIGREIKTSDQSVMTLMWFYNNPLKLSVTFYHILQCMKDIDSQMEMKGILTHE